MGNDLDGKGYEQTHGATVLSGQTAKRGAQCAPLCHRLAYLALSSKSNPENPDCLDLPPP